MRNYIYPLLALVLLGCKDNALENADMTIVEEAQYDAMEAPAAAAADVSYDSAPAPYEQKIIKNADLQFETDNLEETASRIKGIVKKYNAQIQHDSESKDYGSLRHRFTVRVPANNFDAFIADIGQGVSYFDRKEISSQDVTEEFIDVEARVKTKKKLEARYTELLGKATKMSEMLEIEQKLSEIREEIESQEGRLKYLQNRVALSTITIEFYKNIEQEQGATVSYGSKIGNAFKSGFNSLSSFFIDIINLWPFILIFVIAFVLIRKRIRRKK